MQPNILLLQILLVCALSFNINYAKAQVVESQSDSIKTNSAQLSRIAERIEQGVQKYGEENLKHVLYDMLKEDIDSMRITIPMDTIYDAMIRDLVEENQGGTNNAVVRYSKSFRDSLMEKLYYEYYVSKREQKYRDFAANLISASVCKAVKTNDSAIMTLAYDNVLLFRNYEIANQRAIRKHIQSQRIESFRKEYEEYCTALDSLNYSSNYKADWEITVENYGRYDFHKAPEVPTFANIKTYLPENSSMIEFSVVYFSGSPYLCAFIYDNNVESPNFVVLDIPENLINEITNSHSSNTINSLYKGEKLYESIISPLEPYIKGTHLYIAPTSFLAKLNFSAIRHDEKLLEDKYHITRLFSATDLLDNASIPPIDIALFGDVKFDLSNKELENSTSRYHVSTESNRGELQPLPYSLNEVKSIQNVIARQPKARRLKVKTYLGKNASEAAFKSFDRDSPSIIHFATHGYYLGAEERPAHVSFNQTELNSNKLIFSGLLLAGATLAWNGNLPKPGVEDGILTADEISRMDLSRTKLVITSACSTALGDETETEGMFSLQRAFKQAGVKMQILTLWPVGDQVASEFMSTFYKNWTSTQEIEKSFVETQRQIRTSYPETYRWAPFILVGNDM